MKFLMLGVLFLLSFQSNDLKFEEDYCKSIGYHGSAVTGRINVFESTARFYGSGSLKEGKLCESKNMHAGGNWFKLKSDEYVGFHSNGRFSYGTLAEDERFESTLIEAGEEVEFDSNGILLN